MTLKTCSCCKEPQSLDSFSKNGKYIYTVCKSCKNKKHIERTYGLTTDQVHIVCSVLTCNCCHCEFTKINPKHVHHLSNGSRSVLCQKCNLILGQESEMDLLRIEACLNFLNTQRKNLRNRDNQQGSPSDPSTTERRPRKNEFICNRCNRPLSIDSFRIDRKWRRKTCKHCEVCLESARVYGITYKQAFELYSMPECNCCHQSFTSKNKATIHHICDKVIGVLCDGCNRRLGQETEQQVLHLQACKTWIQLAMMVQSDLHGNMKS